MERCRLAALPAWRGLAGDGAGSPGRDAECFRVGAAVVLGQGLAEGAGAVGDGAAADLAAGDRQVGDGDGKRRDCVLLICFYEGYSGDCVEVQGDHG